jgi:ribosomal protein S18 acetylase RimI-like enzyme
MTTPPGPEPPPVEIREYRPGDGPALRRLWDDAGLRSLGDDDDGLTAMARRNPGLLLVATAGDAIVGSGLGGWDGRRGWIYHVVIAPDHRRRGIGRRLVAQVETGLQALGCPKVNVIVMDENDEGVDFWVSMGYGMLQARQFGRVLAQE